MSRIPTRLLILKRLSDLLAGITPANGYDADLTDKVFRGRILFGTEIGPLPAVSLLESPHGDPVSVFHGDWNDMDAEQWTILVQGLVKDDPINPTDPAYYMLAEVQSRLALINATDSIGNPVDPVAFNLGGLINGIEIGPPVVRPPETKISATAFFFLPIRLDVSLSVGEPYTTT